jgi:hypothetical protein
MRRLTALLTGLAFVIAGLVVATPAEAATYVTVVNFTDKSIFVNGTRVTAGHHINHVKRKTMRVKPLRCSVIEGMNRSGKKPPTRVYLTRGVYTSGGAFKSNKRLSDGDLNRFGVFWAKCRS